MSDGVLTAVVAVVGALFAAASGMFAASQARKANVATVDKDIFDSLRSDFLASKAEIRELEKEVDAERLRRRDMEEVVHRISLALYAAGIPIPDSVAALLRPPPNTRAGS